MGRYYYFEKPTQIKFWDIQPQDYVGGIGYHDEVICGECGHVMKINDIYDEVAEAAEAGEPAPDLNEVIMEYATWVPLNQEITGDDCRSPVDTQVIWNDPRWHSLTK